MSAPAPMGRLDAGHADIPPDPRARVGPFAVPAGTGGALAKLARKRRATAPSPDDQTSRQRSGREALESGHARLVVLALFFALGFSVVGLRVVDLTAFQTTAANIRGPSWPAVVRERADITDRNGVLLATDVTVASLFAEPKKVLDPVEAANGIARALPDLDRNEILARLTAGKTFVWLKRHLTPREQDAVNRLGLPGIGFQSEQERIYPQGPLASHVLGFVDVDNHGLAGVEQYFDERLRKLPEDGKRTPVKLSLDVRVQYVLHDELAAMVKQFRALGAAGLVMDAATGEVLAMVSLPDFDPNKVGESTDDQRFNRATLGIFEPGSTFKVFTLAMAFDLGTARLDDRFDATKPLQISRFTIHDDHAKNKWLTPPEIFIYSSNIGAARMAMEVGGDRQRAFLSKLGLLERPTLEIPELGTPMVPSPWRDVSTVTVAYGHGIAMSPFQNASAFASVVNGGLRIQPTLVARDGPVTGTRVISQATSETMRRLLRLNVEQGTGSKAVAPGYYVGGKTGTADKAVAGGYAEHQVVSSFLSAFPVNAPRYVVLAVLDTPQGNQETQGFVTAGWTVAPTVGRVVSRIGPILGVAPLDEKSDWLRAQMAVSLDGKRNGNAAF